ncbi:MAG: class I SAM-dependent methyltransferase [Methanomassiliicoccales archaeon]
MWLAKVPRHRAEGVRRLLLERGAVRRDRRMVESGEHVLIPLVEEEVHGTRELGLELIHGEAPTRSPHRSPMDEILATIGVPEELNPLLPRKWEKLGDVLVLRIPDRLEGYRTEVARTYGRVLKARTVCRELGGISGVYRLPRMEVLVGGDTRTAHLENGIVYHMDVSKVMFSSGNIDERHRMGELDCRGETVVDMFAGIGYFTLPLAVHSGASRLVACEINPLAREYLQRNIRANQVEDRVEVFPGDNRDLGGSGWADRVVMGYVGTTHLHLPRAIELVRDGGVLHYHETCSVDRPEGPVDTVRGHADRVEVLSLREIKSYAPAVSHMVMDCRIWK